jgi:hypothetical protein
MTTEAEKPAKKLTEVADIDKFYGPDKNRIIGKIKEGDEKLAEPVDLAKLDIDRVQAVNAADDYISRCNSEKAVAFGAAAVVMAFGCGAGLVGTMWYLSSIGYLS